MDFFKPNSLLYAVVRYLLCRQRKFRLAFIFQRTFEAIASPLNLESNQQPSYSTVLCYLIEWPAKNILVSLKPVALEKRMDLVLLSPKWIDRVLSMNYWDSDNVYLTNFIFNTFSIFLNILMLVENASVVCIQIGASF